MRDYKHYQKMVTILERLKRESDIIIAQRLLDNILDAQDTGELTPEQVLSLAERIQAWKEKREQFFLTQEYQLNKLMQQLDKKKRRKDAEKP